MKSTAIKRGAPIASHGPSVGASAAESAPISNYKHGLPYRILQTCASLRITVVLFVLSFVLVFYGTWAQVDAGIWTVVNQYFRWWFVWIPLKVVVLRTLDVPGAIPFPGGWTLGALLLTNLLAAHAIRFKMTWKRSGVMVLHIGLILMMVGEFVTGVYAIEGRMTIAVGQACNYVEHDRKTELAIVDASDPSVLDEIVIPHAFLLKGGLIQDHRLPFDVVVDQYMANSAIFKAMGPGGENPATTGIGLTRIAKERPETAGAGTEQAMEIPSAYVTLRKKNSDVTLGTYLMSTYFTFILRPPDEVVVDGKKYEISLRAKRSYRPYAIYLKDFKHEVFPGTKTARNYQSDVRLTDKERNEDREVKIYMNHPLRYDGETFYQASLHPLARGTVLQVVRNPGWLLPYFSCALVTLGMLVHFGILLLGFIRRSVA